MISDLLLGLDGTERKIMSEEDRIPEYKRRKVLKPHSDAHGIVEGTYITEDAVVGTAVITPEKYSKLDSNTIVVIKEADITWFPLIRQAEGVIVEEGTVASHFAQMLREMNLPAIIGAKGACSTLTDRSRIAMTPVRDEQKNAAFFKKGSVLEGEYETAEEAIDIPEFPATKTKIYALCSFERRVKQLKDLPISGIGLMRSEFLNNYLFGIHPLAVLAYSQGKTLNRETRRDIETIFGGIYGFMPNLLPEAYVRMTVDAIADVAKHIPNRRINYRLCDLRTDDARNLIGGKYFEPVEKNPMLGWRGATKLIDDKYREGLYLELEIVKRAREKGIDMHILVPFCRTPEDGARIVQLIRDYGIKDAEIGSMVEMPSNIMLADEFAEVFDFFLTGPMDLTQSIFMSDRERTDSARYCNIDNKGIRAMVRTMLQNMQRHSKDVIIGEYEVFKGLEEYMKYAAGNRLHMNSLPDLVVNNIFRVSELERRVGI